MEEIAQILNEWDNVRIPIEIGSAYCFEKVHEITESPNNQREYEITVVMRDRHTHWNGKRFESSHVGVYVTSFLRAALQLADMQNEAFGEWINMFTTEVVNSRRAELENLRLAGATIEQRP